MKSFLSVVEKMSGNKPVTIMTKPSRSRWRPVRVLRLLAVVVTIAVVLMGAVIGVLAGKLDQAIARGARLEMQIDRVFVDRAVAAIVRANPAATEPFAREVVWAVIEISGKYNVDPRIALGKIGVESAFNPRAMSNAGALGLSQVMPGIWAGELQREGIVNSASDLYTPARSVDAGLYILRQYLDRYDGDYRRALAAYNAGPGGNAGDYPERVLRWAGRV